MKTEALLIIVVGVAAFWFVLRPLYGWVVRWILRRWGS
jgi:hypothetical protein